MGYKGQAPRTPKSAQLKVFLPFLLQTENLRMRMNLVIHVAQIEQTASNIAAISIDKQKDDRKCHVSS
jgi:hypothetical protein